MLRILLLLLGFLSLSSSQLINPSAKIGEIDHNFEIRNGEAVLTIPLPIMKGVKNLRPAIQLVYSSNAHSENGVLGLGWSIRGLSEISRCAKSIAYDGVFDKIRYSYADKFCLDGQRLLLLNGTYGYASSVYTTEMNSYQKIVAYETEGQGPKYFKIFTKDNLIITLGGDLNSRVQSFIQGTVSKWLISSIEDYLGNKITFSYTVEPNYTYISSISYANKLVSFSYEQRNDVIKKYYDQAINYMIQKRVKQISFISNGSYIKSMHMDYTKFSPAELSLLKSVKMCFSDTICTEPLVFEYESEEGTISYFAKQIYHDRICGFSTICELVQMADMDGDGLQDIIGFGDDGVYVSINMGESFQQAQKWISQFCKISGWTTTAHYRFLADMNNDGLPDIVGFGNEGVYVGLNNDKQILAPQIWIKEFGNTNGWLVGTHLRMVIDVNGDGFLDVLGYSCCGIYVAYGNGKSLGNVFLLAAIFPVVNGWDKFFKRVTDLNADGIKDFIGIDTKIWSTLYFSTGSMLQIQGNSNFDSTHGWNTNYFRELIDLNNDNLPDLLGVDIMFGIYVGTSNLEFSKPISFSSSKWGSKNPSEKTESIITSDLNGDSYPDLVVFKCDSVEVVLNTGKQFLSLAKWNTDSNFCDNKQIDDVNEDGFNDLVSFSGNAAKVSYNLNKSPKLLRIRDSYGNIKSVKYERSSNQSINEMGSFNVSYDYQTRGFSLDLVSEFSSSNGIGSMNTIQYKYGGYKCTKVPGRRSCSFGWIKTQEKNSKISTKEEFYTEFPLTGLLKSKSTFYENNLISKTSFDQIFIFSKTNDYLSSFETHLKGKFSESYEIDGKYLKGEATSFKYDSFGNAIQIIESVFDANNNYTVATTVQTLSNTNTWFIDKPIFKSVYYIWKSNNKTDTKTSQESYFYDDNKRLLTKIIENPNSINALEKSYHYDNHGNTILSIR